MNFAQAVLQYYLEFVKFSTIFTIIAKKREKNMFIILSPGPVITYRDAWLWAVLYYAGDIAKILKLLI